MSEQDTNSLVTLAKEWVNILSVTPLPNGSFAVAIEYTVPPDPSFRQSQYKTATRWVKYVAILSPSEIISHASLAEAVLRIVKNVRRVLEHGQVQ